jgi:hypothetical protein
VHMNIYLTKTYDIFTAVKRRVEWEEILKRGNSLTAINPHLPNKEVTREYF